MTHSNDDFTPETIDEQIERFLQLPELRQQVPSAALTQALKVVCEEDVASLERVRERYAARLQAMPASSTQFSTNVSSSLSQRKEFAMHDLAEKNEPVSIQPSSKRTSRPRLRLTAFVNAVAAVVVVSLLVATSLLLFHSHLQTTTGSQLTVTPTPQPTGGPASHVILKAELTDSPMGNSEGVGPGLSGIVSKNHFTVGQRIWLFYIWSAANSGTVVVKWYADGRLYSSSSQYMNYVAPYQGRGIAPTPGPQRTPTPGPTASVPPTPGPTTASVPISSDFSITYNQPAVAKVELYWNGRLAATLFFVVKSKV